jgi:hypothetical protein
MPVSILDQAPTNTDGVEPLFLTFATQKLFNVRIGEVNVLNAKILTLL